MMLFIAFVIGLGFVFDQIWGTSGSYIGVSLAIILSLVMTATSYFKGDKIALLSTGAKPATKEGDRYVYNMVENLCITAGVPTPKIYIIEDTAINAFATGRKPEMASIAVTRGAIEKLENEELEGVLAHELSHVKNYDIRFMMLVAVMVGTIVIMSDIMFRGHLFGGKRSGKGSGQLGAVFMILGLVFIILSPLIAEIIKLAISRKREYLADASGALLTRYPEGLARALEKIAKENQPMAKASSATAHLFIASPFSTKKKLAGLFSTHPPIEDRVKELRSMA